MGIIISVRRQLIKPRARGGMAISPKGFKKADDRESAGVSVFWLCFTAPTLFLDSVGSGCCGKREDSQ